MANINKTEIDKLLGKTQERQKEIADGNNLYLIVTKIGSCKFKYRVRKNNQASWIALGDYPNMTLNDARQKALQIKSMINNGIDPVINRQQEKTKRMTFRQFAQIYITERLPLVRTKPKNANIFIKLLETQILAIIGDLYLADIDDNAIRNKIFQPKLSVGKHGGAKQIRSMLKVILDYAVEKELIAHNPVGSVQSYNMVSTSMRSRFLNDKEITTMMQLLYPSPIIRTEYKVAIHLLLMLLMRKIELVHATWDKVDFDKATFTISTSKTGSQLVIPLPTQAIALFRILKDLSQGSDYILVGKRGNKPVSEDTLNKQNFIINHLMFGNDREQYFTIHDLRRTGATHLGEMSYPSDYIEVALNHTKGGIKRVYQRSQYLEQRKEMLQKWADKLDELIGVEFLPYGKKFII